MTYSERERCMITGNECGTDTWSVVSPCKCGPCVRWANDEAQRLRLCVEDIQKLIQNHEFDNIDPKFTLQCIYNFTIHAIGEHLPPWKQIVTEPIHYEDEPEAKIIWE